MTDLNTVFIVVYGTLRKGGRAHKRLLELGAVFQEEITFSGTLYGGGAPFPFLHLKGKGTTVGELYLLNAEGLGFLDRFEMLGYGPYQRSTMEVARKDGTVVKAEVYHLLPGKVAEYTKLPLVPGGDWVEHMRQRGMYIPVETGQD